MNFKNTYYKAKLKSNLDKLKQKAGLALTRHEKEHSFTCTLRFPSAGFPVQ